jgi:hypothetical protein
MNDPADSIATLREVRATFASPAQMQDAVSRLSMSGFDRADLSLPSPGLIKGTETPEAGTKPASTEADARQVRALGASTAAAVAALAAAGVTVATGGAAGGSVFAIHRAAGHMEQQDRDSRAAAGDLVLAVRAATDTKRSAAEAILRAAGATDIKMID